MGATLKIWDTYISPASNALLDLGSDALEFKDIWIDGVAYIDSLILHGDLDMGDFDITSIDRLEGLDPGLFIDMGQNSQILISSDGAGTPFSTPDIDITGSVYFDDHIGLALDKQLQFGDNAVYIFSDDDGRLDLHADTSIDMNDPVDFVEGVSYPTVNKTGAYTATDDDYLITCNATSAAFTVTLPAAASHAGRKYVIKKIDSSANAVTIDGNGSETIDDGTTAVLNAQYEAIQITSNGSGWWVT